MHYKVTKIYYPKRNHRLFSLLQSNLCGCFIESQSSNTMCLKLSQYFVVTEADDFFSS